MHVGTDAAATLGSRFSLIFDPRASRVYHVGHGKFKEQPLELTAGIRTPEGDVWALPFTSTAAHPPYHEYFSTLTTVRYRGVQPNLGLQVSLKVRAPFYPRDAKSSTAPFFYVRLRVERLERFRGRQPDAPLRRGHLLFELSGKKVPLGWKDGVLTYRFNSTSTVESDRPNHPAAGRSRTCAVHGWLEADDGSAATDTGFQKEFDLSSAGSAEMHLLWWSWAPEAAMELFETEATFKYQQLFGSPAQMVKWARGNRTDIESRCDFLDRSMEGCNLGVATSNLVAAGLHTFLANTWWVVRSGGKDWFSVSGGARGYQSAVDVEYNAALLYLALWPELLDMLLDQWVEFEQDGSSTLGPDAKGSSYLSRDMGSRFFLGTQCSHHPTEVETNADYLLLLAARTAWSGKPGSARAKMPLCRRLAEFIFKSDTSGNGLPDAATANAMDDGSPALQFGKNQVYLSIKAQAALSALAEIEEACDPQNSRAERWRAFVAKGIKTLDSEGWLGDHYPVTLPTDECEVRDPWTGEVVQADQLKAWDDYSIYTANGLLYLYLANLGKPRWRSERLARDVENAERRCRTPYGCTHTATGDESVWFSQNMWRDFTAAYLGIDLLNNLERYQDYQLLAGDSGDSSLYCDSTPTSDLRFHPRGATVFGAPLAAAGLRLNRLQGELILCPVRTTLDVPLLPFADWQRMRIPWLHVRQREGVATARISNRDLLEGLTLEMLGAELEKT